MQELRSNILNGVKSVQINSSVGPEVVDLINWTTGVKPTERPQINEVLEHVFFWTDEQRMSLVEELSDPLVDTLYVLLAEATERVVSSGGGSVGVVNTKSVSSNSHGSSKGNLQFSKQSQQKQHYYQQRQQQQEQQQKQQQHKENTSNINWMNAFPANLQANLLKHRNYNTSSLLDLLRAVRNLYQHFKNQPEEALVTLIELSEYGTGQVDSASTSLTSTSTSTLISAEEKENQSKSVLKTLEDCKNSSILRRRVVLQFTTQMFPNLFLELYRIKKAIEKK